MSRSSARSGGSDGSVAPDDVLQHPPSYSRTESVVSHLSGEYTNTKPVRRLSISRTVAGLKKRSFIGLHHVRKIRVNSSSGSGQPFTLLLVEDNAGDARLVKEAVDETRFTDELHTVSDGEEALDFVHQRGDYTDARRPDLILLDWHLPGTSGEEVLAALKGDRNLSQIPVIVLTGSLSEREVIQAYTTHANACITKSSDPDAVIEAMHVLEEFWLSVARLPQPTDEGEEDGARRLG